MLLLLRVRDEMRMTISAYESLYESSIAYGIRKALVAEQRRTDLTLKLRDLNENKKDLQNQIDTMKANIENTIKKAEEKRASDELAHAEEKDRIEKTNANLKTSLEALLAAPKK